MPNLLFRYLFFSEMMCFSLPTNRPCYGSLLANLQFALLIFIVSSESMRAADLKASPQLRRCVSLSSNMDSGEEMYNLRNTVGRAAYIPAHSPAPPASRSQPACAAQKPLICEASTGQTRQRGSQEYTQIQTQLSPNIRF